jgi:Zn-dependent M28 family amino/carboxypeptidase
LEFEPNLNLDNIEEHLNVLAHDSMFGRLAGSEQELLAAEYIRDEYIEYGLAPGIDLYMQTFDGGPAGPPLDERYVSQNVLAVIPGEGSLAGEWLVLGAHYDHVGWIMQADTALVYNGADDNASGTALLLELARGLAEWEAMGGRGPQGRRSIMIHTYGAEEAGLVGSRHFCENPTVPIGDIVAMLNFDMVGRFGQNGLILIGYSSSPDWLDILSEVDGETPEFRTSDSGLSRSDQACFYERQRPVLFFHTGSHSEYHTPYDDIELIDLDGMMTIGELAAGLVVRLAVRSDPPVFGGVLQAE